MCPVRSKAPMEKMGSGAGGSAGFSAGEGVCANAPRETEKSPATAKAILSFRMLLSFGFGRRGRWLGGKEQQTCHSLSACLCLFLFAESDVMHIVRAQDQAPAPCRCGGFGCVNRSAWPGV